MMAYKKTLFAVAEFIGTQLEIAEYRDHGRDAHATYKVVQIRHILRLARQSALLFATDACIWDNF